jgi:tight adherence protein C
MVWTDAVAVLWGLSAGSLTWGVLERRRAEQLRRRMERLGVRADGEGGRALGLDARVFARTVGAGLSKRWPSLRQRRGALAEGASIADMTGEELVGWQALVAVSGVLLGLMIVASDGVIGLIFLLVLPPIGWFMLQMWLLRRRAARLKGIERALLTVMDLLGLSLEAGMSLDRALRLICDRVDSPLTEELRLVLAEIDLGVARRAAFAHLAERLDLEDIRALTTAIVQADELSMSLVESMRIQGHGLRVKRRQEAEAEAQRAPVKMLFPLVLFILPALFIVILAPVVLQLMKALAI